MRRFGGAMKSAAPSAAQGRQAPSLPGFYRCPPEIHLSPLLVGPSFLPPPLPRGHRGHRRASRRSRDFSLLVTVCPLPLFFKMFNSTAWLWSLFLFKK